ncbi:MAG TPA: efflux RND transporter permease subunit [Acidobacteriaceae bacterium]|nr:efflux RND transporter permease subunit [Acidobacteriaceae bacterium]
MEEKAPVQDDKNLPSSGDAPEKGAWFSIFSKAVITVIVAMAGVGIYAAFSIPIAVFPTTNFPRVLIAIDNGVMPIDQMMVTITRPIEEAVNSVQGLRTVRSITSRGSAEVDLYFNWKVDMFRTLQRVYAAMSRVQSGLPPTVSIDIHRLRFSSFPILSFGMTSDSIPSSKLWGIATYQIKPRLNRVNGVSSVLVQGGDVPEFDIIPDPAKLLRTGITVSDILAAVQKSNLIESPGLISSHHQLVLDLVDSQVHDPSELAKIVVKRTSSGVPVTVGDIAQVKPAVAPRYTVVTSENKPAVLLSISRQPGANTVTVSDGVYAELAQIKKTLPPGVHFSVFYDQGELVKEAIASVRDAILIGIILACIVLVLFLRDWGSSLVAGLVIPVTVAVTFLVLKVLGETFNLMTLGGLAAAVGLVIDDAIVVVENIVVHRDAGQGRSLAIRSALSELKVPLVGSTATPVVIFLPLILITGVTGVFFRALAITMASALVTSLILALTWTPTLSQYFVRRKDLVPADEQIGEFQSPEDQAARILAAEEASIGGWMKKIITFYERVLKLALDHPWWLVAFSLLLVLGSYLSYSALGSGMLPKMDEGEFTVDYVMPPGSSLAETNRALEQAVHIIRSIPEVVATSRRTGLQLGLAAVTEANTGDISVRLSNHRSRSIYTIMNEVQDKVSARVPVLDIDLHQTLEDTIGDLTNAPQPVVIKLFCENPATLRKWAPIVADKISKVPGVVGVLDGIDNTISSPETIYHIQPSVAAQNGFTPEELSMDTNALLDGDVAPIPMIVGNRMYNIRVRFPQQFRATPGVMDNTVFLSSTGTTSSLGSLVTIQHLPGQTEILEENLQRLDEVSARLEGSNLGKAIPLVKKAVASLNLPPEIRVAYGGTYASQQQSFHDLLKVLFAGMLLVFFVLLFEFRSFSAPVSIMASAVMSTSGVFLALLITGTEFNISSFMGLIMVVGIVAKNGILLLDADVKFRDAGMHPREAMIQAGRRRLRPIMMTAVAAVCGMFPLALALGAGSQMLQPLAIAVIGGILISMVLSLIITPAVHYYMSGKEEPA